MTHRVFASLILAIGLVVTVGLAVTTTTAFAIDNPIPGVDIIVKKHPGGIVVQTKTDARGNFTIGTLAPGEYEIDVLSWSWGTTSGKLDPNPKSALHVVLVEVLVSSIQSPVVSNQQTVGPGQSISVRFTVPGAIPGVNVAAGDVNGDGRAAKTHQYIGIVTLVK